MSGAAGHLKILVASDSAAEIALVGSLLEDEFEDNVVGVDSGSAAAVFLERQAAVLVLAFRDLRKAEEFYLGIYRRGAEPEAQIHTHRTILLCGREEVRAAYQLCRGGLFDDYVQFWPMTYDVPRLALSVHRSLKECTTRAAVTPEASGEGRTPPSSGIAIDPTDAQTQEPIDAGQAPASPRRCILIVDDDAFQRKLFGQVVESEGHRAEFAGSGEEALSRLRTVCPDLILMDLQMPDLTGLEVIERIKLQPQVAEVPVIIVTGKAEREVVLESVRRGAADFIVKPVNRGALVGKISRLLTREALDPEAGA